MHLIINFFNSASLSRLGDAIQKDDVIPQNFNFGMWISFWTNLSVFYTFSEFPKFLLFFILYFLRKKIQFQKHLATSQRTPSILFGFISSKLIYKVFLKNFGCLTLFLFNKNENPISPWWIDLINQLVSSLPLLVGSTISNRPNKKLQGPTKPFWPCGRAATGHSAH